MRSDNRTAGQLRPIKITRNFTEYAEGSVLIECGKTKVICTATVEDSVPRWLKGSGRGWVTAEYSLLPRSTQTRVSREAAKGKQTGRTVEIQRLIGRALRAVVDLEALGERSITIDCDVIQADGGTRTASITGAFVALVDAVDFTFGGAGKFPITDFCAAIVDMNVVRTGSGNMVEVQGTGEHGTFNRDELNALLDLAEAATDELMAKQREVLGPTADKVGKVYPTAPEV